MGNIICGLLFIGALAYLTYRLYCFFARDEIINCFGEHYRWKDEEGARNKANRKKTNKNVQ